MKILITNDDGVFAPALPHLIRWAKKYGEVIAVAPKVEQSGKSHAIDFMHPQEIKKVEIAPDLTAYSMDSTPADCVRYALDQLGRDFDLILSGVNRGYNLGGDIVYSGTVGAIFEASKHGIPAIAFSTFVDGQKHAYSQLDTVYKYITENKLLEENPLYNVNIPNEIKGIRITYQGSQYFSDHFEKLDGDIYIQTGERIPDEYPYDLDRDTVAIHEGFISLTPLLATRTNMEIFYKHKK